jgi:GNAT superfamily N-acetyltransferase
MPPFLTLREVDRQTWADLVRLFEAPGGPKFCWCMVWRATPAEAKLDGAGRKAALRARVEAGIPIGLVGHLDGEPVAWCSIAPRETYRRLKGVQDETPEKVWTLACFFVVRRLRGQGITRQLIEAAVQHARQKGATVVEAYPVDTDAPSYRFMGSIAPFVAAGFTEVGRVGRRRHLMRLRVG